MSEPSPEVIAEAAAWIALLHGPNRTAATDRGLQRWLAADSAHASAFEAMTAAWEVTGSLPRQDVPRASRWQRAGYRQGFLRSMMVVAALAVLALGAVLYFQKLAGITTEVGEQRLLTLEDGTRVYLNTDTRLVTSYEKDIRRVILKSGEAQFDVAENPGRPFVVVAGAHEVMALGTSFIVREDPRLFSVVLVEGKVKVDSMDSVTLSPGQRLMFAANTTPQLDRPSIERVAAWRRGLVDFDNLPLGAAVAEMNRYSKIKLTVASPAAGAIAVTGVFRAGDAASFAAAVAGAYGLRVTEREGELQLTDAPPGKSN